MKFFNSFILHFIFFLFAINAFSQDSISFFAPASTFKKNRFEEVAALQAIGYGGSLAALNIAWYKNYSHSSFHFFNDNSEWLQVDKAGHFLTSWYLGRIGSDMYEWSGVKKKKAVLLGALSGWGYLTAIETLDGFSNGWGFSWGDFSANTLGSALIIGQKLIHSRTDAAGYLMTGFRNMSLKFSFHQTDYPQFRPTLLGQNLSEQILKDYNGQTYWLSMNISSFMNYNSKFPKWLNVAFGYGAEGMISGSPGYYYVLPTGEQVEVVRNRKYFLSLDIDLARIKTKSKFLKTLAETFCFIKIPAPSIEFSTKGVKAYGVYY